MSTVTCAPSFSRILEHEDVSIVPRNYEVSIEMGDVELIRVVARLLRKVKYKPSVHLSFLTILTTSQQFTEFQSIAV